MGSSLDPYTDRKNKRMIINRYSDINKTDSTLRPYQQKAKREIFEAWDEVDNVMFQMPTGTGKTRLFTSIIRDINDYSLRQRKAVKILIIAHRTELIKQIDKSLRKYEVAHNIIAGGKEKNYKFPVNIASIQTITHPSNLRDAKKLNVQFVIIDEAHHALAASYRKLWDMYPDAKRLGVTATPWRMNHQSFTDLFDKLVLSMPIKDFIKQGFLSPYKYYSLKNDSDIQKTIDDIELDKFGEFKESSMEEKMDIGSIRAQLLDSYLSLAEGKKGIIYAINIVHARHICKEYEEAGYRAVSIDSKTPAKQREELVEKFRKNEIDIIVNVDIFSEGFDCPDIEFIQLARPTRSLVKYLQQVGRGLRPTANKQNCIILDNVGMYSRFGLPDARRHWRHHFLGKKVDEAPQKTISKGTGKTRYVDLSEGTEDMELIQDISEEVGSTDGLANIDVSANIDEAESHSDVGTEEEVENTDVFDPTLLLEDNNYKDDNFIFWFMDTEQVYEAYIQDDRHFVISELIIDEPRHCVYRLRVGKISADSWMFGQMLKEDVSQLQSIQHFKANYTVFHYQEQLPDNSIRERFFDYKGKEIDMPTVVEEKYDLAKKSDGRLNDYIDVPVSKAWFGVEILRKSSSISVTRTVKGITKIIAIFNLLSDFGRMYYGLKGKAAQSCRKHKVKDIDFKKLREYKSDTCHICFSDINSFTVRSNEDDGIYLYKYNFKGKQIGRETIEDSTASKESVLSESDISKLLWHTFDKKTTSYEYFWILSIIQLYKETKKDSISYKQILARMVANAWRYVFKEGGDFPDSDQTPRLSNAIMPRFLLKETSDPKQVEGQILYYYERARLGQFLSPLLENVPYRFLSPWIPFTSNEDIVAKSNNPETRCPYSLHNDHIEINPIWGGYMIEKYDKITKFVEQELKSYLKIK